MRKAKLRKEVISDIRYMKADAITTAIAGVEQIMKRTTNYFDEQDTAFYKPYMESVKWCFKFLDRFYTKLIAMDKHNSRVFVEAESKFNYMVSEAMNMDRRQIGFNLLNEREKADYMYYSYISAGKDVLKAIIHILKSKEEYIWSYKYFKMIDIQLSSICNIFKKEMGVIK